MADEPSSSDDSRSKDRTSPDRINTLKSWPSSWQDGSRRSAFQLYRPTIVLTNVQRGNIEADTSEYGPEEVSWFEKAGRGDLTRDDISYVSDINLSDENGLNALMWSSAYGHISSVTRLVEAGINIYHRGKRKQTALHLAANGGHHNVIKVLISHGAVVNEIDSCGNTPLMYAVLGNHVHAITELLKSGADPSIKNCLKQWPYQLAIERNLSQAQTVMESHMLFALSNN